jgi:hypothetical protein
MSTPSKKLGPFSLNDVFSWQLEKLQQTYRLLHPGQEPSKTKDPLRQKILAELIRKKLLKDATEAYADVPLPDAQGVPPSSPSSLLRSDPQNQNLSSNPTNTVVRELEDPRLTTVMSEHQSLKISFSNMEKLLSDLLAATVDKQTKQTEDSERMARRNNVRITKLQETADPLADAQALFEDMGCSVMVVEARRLGRAQNSYAARAAGDSTTPSNSPRPLIITLADFGDKLSVLRNRKNLKDSKFSKVGIDEDLTKAQMESKRAAWPAFIAARQCGKRAYWRGHTLYIDGIIFTPSPNSTT